MSTEVSEGAVRGEQASGGIAIRSLFGPLRRATLPAGVIIALFVLWAVAVPALHIREYLIPTPGAVWHSVIDNSAILRSGAVVTGKEVVVGFLLAVVVAIPLGVALGESALLQRAIYPLMVVAQVVPKVALGPLMIVWFGLGMTAKVIFIVLLSFFPIIVNTMVGVASASVDFRRLAESVGLGTFSTLRKITLPQALPSVFAGLKVGITLSVIGAVVAEFITAQNGLGFLILTAQGQVDTPLLFASILSLTVLGLLFYGIVALVERIALPWQSDVRG